MLATRGYEASVPDLARLRLDRDEISHDGIGRQLASIQGDTISWRAARLVVAV